MIIKKHVTEEKAKQVIENAKKLDSTLIKHAKYCYNSSFLNVTYNSDKNIISLSSNYYHANTLRDLLRDLNDLPIYVYLLEPDDLSEYLNPFEITATYGNLNFRYIDLNEKSKISGLCELYQSDVSELYALGKFDMVIPFSHGRDIAELFNQEYDRLY